MIDPSAELKVQGTSAKAHIAKQSDAEAKALADYRPRHKVRFVTAASLFDAKGVSHGEIKPLEPFGIAVLAFRDPDNIQVELTAPLV